MARSDKRTLNVAAYAGKWVAFSKNKILAAGSSLPEVMRKLPPRSRALKPAVFLVPRQDEGPYVLFLIPPAC